MRLIDRVVERISVLYATTDHLHRFIKLEYPVQRITYLNIINELYDDVRHRRVTRSYVPPKIVAKHCLRLIANKKQNIMTKFNDSIVILLYLLLSFTNKSLTFTTSEETKKKKHVHLLQF